MKWAVEKEIQDTGIKVEEYKAPMSFQVHLLFYDLLLCSAHRVVAEWLGTEYYIYEDMGLNLTHSDIDVHLIKMYTRRENLLNARPRMSQYSLFKTK